MNQIRQKETILITGATGFIGHLLVKKIVESNQVDKVTIILPVRNLDKARILYKDELEKLDVDIRLLHTSIEALDLGDMQIDYMIHCAAITKSLEMIKHPVEVADGIVLGTRSLLEAAYQKKVKSFVYVSSMEVYGCVEDTGQSLDEEQLGDISLSSSRSCYSLGKRMAEHYCNLYYQEYGLPIKIARLAQVFGKGIQKEDNRVFVQFAKAAITNEDIILKTSGMSMGNYCESEDAIRAIYTILKKGIDGETYNVVNEKNTMRIKEMAELVASKITKGKINVRYEVSNPMKYGYAPETGLRLSSYKLKELGWRATKGMEEMYKDLIDELLANKEEC